MAAGKTGLDLLQLLTKRICSTNGFDRVLNKLQIVSGGEGKCTAELEVKEEHQNHGGTLHGGLTATIVDIVSTLALMTYKGASPPGVSVDLHVTYLKAAKLGDSIVVEASTLKAGKKLAFLNVDISNKSTGELLAKGSHTKYVG